MTRDEKTNGRSEPYPLPASGRGCACLLYTSISAVTVTNQLKKADLTIRKVIEGPLSDQELAALKKSLTFTVTDASGEPAFTVKGDNPSGRWDGNTFTYTQQLLPRCV